MPTYEYECQACGKVHEIFHGINDKPARKCPSCGKPRLRKLISAGAGILFKGSGFYTTDYRSKEYKEKAEKAEKGDKAKSDKGESGGGSKSESKSDSKSDSKSESKSGGGSGAKSDSNSSAKDD